MASIRKRGVSWVADVYKDGKRKSKSFPTKAQARSWAMEMESRLSEGVDHDATMGDLFKRYSEEISDSKKGAIWENRRLNALMDSPMATIRLVDIKREHFDQWIQTRLKAVKSSTVNRELNLISHSLTWARRWRMMEHNPMTDLERPKDPPHRDRRIAPEEEKAIPVALGYFEEIPVTQQKQRVAVAFLFALETAMRAGEIVSLIEDNIYLDRRVVYLPETKNGRPRWVPLSTEAVRLLKRVEPWKEGKPFPMKSGHLSTVFRKAVLSCEIKDLTFHDTRHEAITRLAKKLDVLDLARMVGHSDIKQLRTYYNATADEIAQLLD